MKKLVFGIFILVLMHSSLIAQTEWRLKAFVGMSDAALLEKVNFLGGASYEVSDFYDLGLRIQRKWHPKWSIETGLSYSFAQILISPNIPPGTTFPINGLSIIEESTDFEMLSLPVLASYQLFDFLALQAGPMLNFQLSDSPGSRQSGLGYLIGLSLSYDFDKFGLFLQPNFKRHASIVPFEQNYRRLTEFGLQLGLAYKLSSSRMN